MERVIDNRVDEYEINSIISPASQVLSDIINETSEIITAHIIDIIHQKLGDFVLIL